MYVPSLQTGTSERLSSSLLPGFSGSEPGGRVLWWQLYALYMSAHCERLCIGLGVDVPAISPLSVITCAIGAVAAVDQWLAFRARIRAKTRLGWDTFHIRTVLILVPNPSGSGQQYVRGLQRLDE